MHKAFDKIVAVDVSILLLLEHAVVWSFDFGFVYFGVACIKKSLLLLKIRFYQIQDCSLWLTVLGSLES